MRRWTAVQLAEFAARKRAYAWPLLALVFVAVQAIQRPRLLAAAGRGGGVRGAVDAWVLLAGLMLLLLATGGGVVWGRQVRALLNDESARAHARIALSWGYWVAMGMGLGCYVTAAWVPLTARGVAYLVVTPGVVAPLLVYAWLEYRALRNRA